MEAAATVAASPVEVPRLPRLAAGAERLDQPTAGRAERGREEEVPSWLSAATAGGSSEALEPGGSAPSAVDAALFMEPNKATSGTGVGNGAHCKPAVGSERDGGQ